MGDGQALSRKRIVAAAIELADRDGLDAVSMRRVADHLGSGTMSLYRHVPNKDTLVVAMVDAVTGRYAYPDAEGLDWRERMRLLARHDWEMYLAHPWVLVAFSTVAPPFGPESLKAMEWALTALEPLDLPPEEAGQAIMTINNYLQGSARVAVTTEAGAATDGPGAMWQARLAGERLDTYPRLRRLVGSRFPPRGQTWFESGLDLILDGIATRHGSRHP
ncbi:TetR/AcrR family transcriptional regulator [Polymorphospora sp. NPDC050346]|uniref:TetR/AcrR family transcriptional regulator n=1 Tax=Polymorphospora sp. NPDC050346 TaxID=3155780 RepID=UPI00340CBE50